MHRDIDVDGWKVRLDLAPQVLHLECPEDIVLSQDELRLTPSVAGVGHRDFPSAAILGSKAKAFDDALGAAVERAAQQGAGTFAAKSKILVGVAGRLGAGNAAAVLHAACRLGGVAVNTPPALVRAVEDVLKQFEADEKRSKPLGFYSEGADLAAIFRQDRMLQEELPTPDALAAARAISGDTVLRADYERWMTLASRFTNPFVRYDLRPLLESLQGASSPPGGKASFLPPSESPEGALVKRLYGNTPIPPGFKLDQAVIDGVRKGTLSLAPKRDSGWYDHIVASLESLAAPERAPEAPRLVLGDLYRAHLLDLFRAFLALARESHVKQLEIPRAGCGPPRVLIRPSLSTEPLPTHYLRRGMGYGFVKGVLVEAFGSDALGTIRLASGESVASSLDGIEQLFLGAHVASCNDLGIAHDAAVKSPDAALKRFRDFAAGMSKDADLTRDNRMMVPVFYDVQRRTIRVWAFLGWTTKPVTVSFMKEPTFEVGTGPKGGLFSRAPKPPQIEFEPIKLQLAFPVTAEVEVTKLMNRAEFRAHCDRLGTQEAIVKGLK